MSFDDLVEEMQGEVFVRLGPLETAMLALTSKRTSPSSSSSLSYQIKIKELEIDLIPIILFGIRGVVRSPPHTPLPPPHFSSFPCRLVAIVR